MDTPKETVPRADLRDYLAAERTFLAWLRTGLALMGFGFVVARFGLFLQQLQVFREAGPGASTGLSLWFGTALIGMGVVVNASAAWQHTRLVRQLDRGQTPACPPTGQNVAIALLLASVGLAMAIYLVSFPSNPPILPSQNRKEKNMTQPAPATSRGIIDRPSNHSVDETVDRIKNILQAKGVTLFALVDHGGEAARVGLDMPPTKLLIFGNPKGGTPLMLSAPSIALDLPLKILVAQDVRGNVRISHNSRNTCVSGTACRRNCCRISRWLKRWPRKPPSDSLRRLPAGWIALSFRR